MENKNKKTNEARIKLLELENHIGMLHQRVEIISELLKIEIERNQKSDEKIVKILVKQSEVLKSFIPAKKKKSVDSRDVIKWGFN